MSDDVIKTGDLVNITIPSPVVVPMIAAPVSLSGSGTSVTVNGQPICLEGDELPTSVRGPLAYTAAPYNTPGMGKLTLTLRPANKTATTENGKAILIKGSQFDALFTVTTPAVKATPDGPVPDPVLAKKGTAQFITTNMTVTAG